MRMHVYILGVAATMIYDENSDAVVNVADLLAVSKDRPVTCDSSDLSLSGTQPVHSSQLRPQNGTHCGCSNYHSVVHKNTSTT